MFLLARTLLAAGAQINALNSQQQSPLYYAAYHNFKVYSSEIKIKRAARRMSKLRSERTKEMIFEDISLD